MRKKLILVAVSFLSVVTAIIVGRIERLDPLFESNVEALAYEDGGYGEVTKCFCKIRWVGTNICTVNADGGYCGGDPCSNHDGNCR